MSEETRDLKYLPTCHLHQRRTPCFPSQRTTIRHPSIASGPALDQGSDHPQNAPPISREKIGDPRETARGQFDQRSNQEPLMTSNVTSLTSDFHQSLPGRRGGRHTIGTALDRRASMPRSEPACLAPSPSTKQSGQAYLAASEVRCVLCSRWRSLNETLTTPVMIVALEWTGRSQGFLL